MSEILIECTGELSPMREIAKALVHEGTNFDYRYYSGWSKCDQIWLESNNDIDCVRDLVEEHEVSGSDITVAWEER